MKPKMKKRGRSRKGREGGGEEGEAGRGRGKEGRQREGEREGERSAPDRGVSCNNSVVLHPTGADLGLLDLTPGVMTAH